jgi:hypothetical protein
MYINQYYKHIYKLEPFPKAEMTRIRTRLVQHIWQNANKDVKKKSHAKWRSTRIQQLRDYQNEYYKTHKKERAEYYFYKNRKK